MYKYFLLFVMFVFMTSFKDGISIEDRLVSLESKVSSLEKENKDLGEGKIRTLLSNLQKESLREIYKYQ